ncbi:MAG TPA: alternative ribosome rescue aminoacyl-tRNA hydrolase ArfB [Acidimicrobiales bacterium]|nr:alternative ribosome rescue aminoacyl-tRNA hydrolase ArfB [Acidimicrobiales bacterium]
MAEVLQVTRTCAISLSEMEWRFTGSGGPGGQHANTANTRVELVFDIEHSPSLEAGDRTRLLERLGPVVRVVASDERSQTRNRQLALERLRAKLADGLHVPTTRRPTRPTAGSRQRRLDAKQRQATLKRQRSARHHDE